jgi:ubiquinone/menaquinone biosynthesis C-methylase UbiE
MNLWQYRAVHPEDAKTFDEAMADHTALLNKTILAGYDFSSFETIVDIGGGDGGLLAAILKAYPNMKGVLFDIPSVTLKAERRMEAERLSDRCEIVSGDFFESVPPGDAYILKAVIHDWNDERASAILMNCRRAMTEDSRLLLIEAVIPPGNDRFFYKFMDLNMMVMTGGRERTEAEYRELLAAAGFRLTRIVPTEFELVVMETVRA